MGSKVLDKDERRPTKPTFKTDDDELTYELNMIEYEALIELHLFNMQLEKYDENGKPELATVTIPANMMYKTAGISLPTY